MKGINIGEGRGKEKEKEKGKEKEKEKKDEKWMQDSNIDEDRKRDGSDTGEKET